MTLVSIDGALDAGADEYNRDTDPAAAEFVFATPGLTIRQFPLETYRRCDALRRVYTDVDVRLLYADLLARLRLHERRA